MTVPDDSACSTCGRLVVVTGRVFRVEAAWNRDHLPEAHTYVEGLLNARRGIGWRARKDAGADILRRLGQLANEGILDIPLELNELQDAIWEVKAGKARVPLFYTTDDDGHDAIRLTHGFWKNTQRTPLSEIDKAKAIRRIDSANTL